MDNNHRRRRGTEKQTTRGVEEKLHNENIKFEDLEPLDGFDLRRIDFESYRTYYFRNDRKITIIRPVGVYIKRGGGSHRVVAYDGTTFYISPGFITIGWKYREGHNRKHVDF